MMHVYRGLIGQGSHTLPRLGSFEGSGTQAMRKCQQSMFALNISEVFNAFIYHLDDNGIGVLRIQLILLTHFRSPGPSDT